MKWLSAFLLLIFTALTFSGCDVLPDFFADSPATDDEAQVVSNYFGDRYSGYGFKALKTDAERQLYACLDERIGQTDRTEFISTALSSAERVSDVLEFYKDDHPEVFWIDESEPYLYSMSTVSLRVEMNYKYEGEELETKKSAMEEKLQAVVNGAPQNGSDYEKELYAHDWLINACSYDDEAVTLHRENDAVRANEQTAYGALVEGRAVCEGYARAFQLICNRLNIPCWVIQGRSEGSGEDKTSGNHIWNCVELDGKWYQVDITWDDIDDEDDSPVSCERYLYFNLTSKMMERDHIFSPLYGEDNENEMWFNAFLPVCDSTDYYYFNLNAMSFVYPDSDECAEYLADAAAKKSDSCCFVVSDEQNYSDAVEDVTNRYAYQWVKRANEINGNSPSLSGDCKLSAFDERRLIVMILNYD